MLDKKTTIKCPKCQKIIDYYASKYRPFCSAKCRSDDLMNWINEYYRIETDEYDDLFNN